MPLPVVGQGVAVAQSLFHRGAFTSAATECLLVLEALYTWASAWDKRLPFRRILRDLLV